MLTYLMDVVQQQQQSLQMCMDLVAQSAAHNGGRSVNSWSHPQSQKLEVPTLLAPDEVNLVVLNDWKIRWQDYATVTRLVEEVPGVGAHQGILRSALTTGWSTLWQMG